VRRLLAAGAAVLGALVVGSAATRDAGEPSADAAQHRAHSSADRTLDAAASTTTIPPTTETTLSTETSLRMIIAGAVAGRDPGKSAAGACADPPARTDATDGQKRPTKGSYGHDRGPRERLEEQVKDEKRTFTALAQALGC
jgi:hypothetical protein